MKQRCTAILAFLVLMACLAGPVWGQNARDSGLHVGLMAGLGSGTDSDVDFDIGVGLQALFKIDLELDVGFSVRVGTLALDSDDTPAFDSDLTYATFAGEYRFNEGYYTSALIFGIGAYDLDAGPAAEDETTIGAMLGILGDFRINDRFSFQLEFSGHYADVEVAQVFLMAHAGVVYHF